MADWERDSPPLQLGQQLQKAGELAHGVRLVPVGIGEVGIDALRLQAGQGAHRGNGVGRLRPVSLITQPARRDIPVSAFTWMRSRLPAAWAAAEKALALSRS